ncbi:tRNA (adenosine(37)-N6)-threonylcarbamoyltransferase complex dimerization subunit type 1 TsaB [Agarivorans sp. B2Z047]|uniref:tRNA (adenosine(37)-N6)-threonylcarbamoyltransferase complex dimerization subunit type 1 TsaB n=1 Tax=Agarivorans sp. B2Z047 TaxID=2652721 RepID=UPI00128DCA90|nr:tRNA (adenosine(37)-N6)-threonylcarbamoyltransferase complex dimerization subunit type 1 TsaB [Agarivorans sp. B2Z047]MPW29508.1 tRNA (adenosine(37)-N6)-threonylcarbamoyltransferase complex dimerization subunit type 1 TsaB [Agarivorans sp. B2Z047]UQN45095.1 tRNA (adenosine(37)-N6)-threonylcarbamoyltransferase complex dimerization subunit type 1 TsaB [Agarivorans sp. B2Z047]
MTANILALDTSTENCSVALQWKGEVISKQEYSPRDHTQKILPFVEQVLAEAGVSLTQLDAIAFGRGPGSFTGVRIGVATAQGLAFGADNPMVAVSTLQAMAQQAYVNHASERCLAAIDARMGEVYWGEYHLEDGLMRLVGQELVIKPELLEASTNKATAVGTGWQTYKELLSGQFSGVSVLDSVLYPAARDMLSYAQYAFERGDLVAAENAEPVYLRDKVTWKKLPGRE